MKAQRLGQDLPGAHARIQRRLRILENHLHSPPKAPPPALGKIVHPPPVEKNAPRVRANQAENDAGQGGFSAAGLAHHAKDFAAPDGKRNAVERARDDAPPGEFAPADEALFQPLGDQQGRLPAGGFGRDDVFGHPRIMADARARAKTRKTSGGKNFP